MSVLATVLAIDTCGAEGTLALARIADSQAALLEQVTLTGRRFAGALVPALRSLLERHGLAVADLHALVVVHGPGSFTGIRMGVSAAKALSEAAGVPVVAVSRLKVLARVYAAECAALDAGRGELYFGCDDGEWLLTCEELLASRGSLPVVCEASLAAALPGARLVTPPTAFDAVTEAQARLVARDFDDVVTLDGNYVRRPEYRPVGR